MWRSSSMDLELMRTSSRSGEMLASMRLLIGRSILKEESDDARESIDDDDELESEYFPSLRISSVGTFFGVDITKIV